MLGIGANELVLILIFGFIIFGPDKLPAMAKTIGQAIARFRRAQNAMTDMMRNEVFDPTAEDPFKNPLDAMARLEKKAQGGVREEGFSEQKARYEKQREAQRRNEQRKAELAAKKAQAKARMEGAQAPAAAPLAPVDAADGPACGVDEPARAPEGAVGAPAIPSVEELYGIKPAPAPAVSVEELYGISPAPKPREGEPSAKDAVAADLGKEA